MILFYIFCALFGIIVGIVLYRLFPLEESCQMGGGGMVRSSEVARIREEIEEAHRKKLSQRGALQ